MGLTKLSDEQIQTALQDLEGWSVIDGKLHKEFQFTDFNEAFGFMARASMHIEKMIIIQNGSTYTTNWLLI